MSQHNFTGIWQQEGCRFYLFPLSGEEFPWIIDLFIAADSVSLSFWLYACMSKILCLLGCCSAVRCRAEREPLTNTKNVLICACVCVSRWLCVHSAVNWSACSLDWMEKGPRARSASADGRARCVAITRHSCSLGMLRKPRPTHQQPPIPPKACLNQSVRGGSDFFFNLSFFSLFWPSQSGNGNSRLTGGEGRRAVFSKSSLDSRADMSLMISTMCFSSVTCTTVTQQER